MLSRLASLWGCGPTPIDYRYINAEDDRKSDNDDDDMDTSRRSDLPIELWWLILQRAAPTPQARFLVARVCKAWRRAVLEDDLAAGRTPMGQGAEACRMRLAAEAMAAADVALLQWTLSKARASAPSDQAHGRLWERLPATGSVACAEVLYAAGRPRCVAGCPCRWSATSIPACRLRDIMADTAKAGHLDLLRALVKWKIVERENWLYATVWESVVHGRVAVLQLLFDEGQLASLFSRVGCMPAYGPCVKPGHPRTWADLAAHNNRVDALVWLCDHNVDGGDLDGALVMAASSGARNAAVWLCERHHLERFAEALVGALVKHRIATATALLAYAGAARACSEAQGETLAEAIARARRDSPALDVAAAVLLDRLLAA
ncbi:F-box domain containing protein [Pandoravirus salinus]|uniref:F-box domain containing protein n=1 Tax=Pandoravirus salinus TaxID=1349410 RepID=S4VW47_9VIRU|nr:F-box domain [Pandoravirus salinus]AGO83651.1 F-box domain containing protein [Pandoravirus salinus]